jgi:hyperosmotically inducible protein
VTTRDRIVTLRGQVNSAAEETQALLVARGTRGVADVVDEISVVPQPRESAPTTGINEGPGVTAQATDAGITAAVKAKLLVDPDVSGLRINVDTHGRVVTLTGRVRTEAEKSRALDIAREAENVTRIVDLLTVQGR